MSPSEKTRVISDVIKNTAAQLVSFPLAMVVAYITARVLGPEMLGLASALAVILRYTSAANLSTLNALNREVPMSIGRGDRREAETIRSVVLGQLILTAIVLCAGILIASRYVPLTIFPSSLATEKYIRIGLGFIAFFAFSQQFDQYFDFYLRSAKEFTFISKLTLLRAAIHTVVTIALVLLFGIVGLWSSSLVVYGVVFAYILAGKKIHLRPSLNLRKVRSLIKIGLPIYIVGTLFTIYLTIDRLLIIKFLSLASLGLYSLTKMVHQTTLLAVPLVAQVMYPRFAEKYGETRDYRSLRQHLERPMLVLSHFIPFMIGLMIFILPVFIRNLLPRYVEGIPAVQFYCGGLFFYSLLGMPANFLITTNKMLPYILFLLLTIATQVGLSVAFIKWGWGINGVALGTTISFMTLAIFLISYVYRYFADSRKEYFRFILRLLFPFVVNVIMVLLLHFAIPETVIACLGGVAVLSIKVVMITLTNIPFFYLANRETGILGIMLSILKKRFMAEAKTGAGKAV